MEWWRISNRVITETHQNFKQTTWVADSRCCLYFMKMNFLTVTGKKQQLYTHQSLPPPPNRHFCGKVGQIPHYCKTEGHKVVRFAGGRSMEARAEEEPIEQSLGQQDHPKWATQHLPKHSIPKLQRGATQEGWAQLQTATSPWTDRPWVFRFPYQISEIIILIEGTVIKINLWRPKLEFSIMQ